MADCACAAHGLAASRLMLCRQDVDEIHRLALALPPQPVVVDLGAGSGTTALAVLEVRDDAFVYSYDSDEDALNWAILAVRNAGHRRRYAPHAWSADTAASNWHGRVDLVLHDAGHGRGDVEGDLRAWLAVAASGTPIWVHDYGVARGADQPANRYPGVARAIRTLLYEKLLRSGRVVGWAWSGARW